MGQPGKTDVRASAGGLVRPLVDGSGATSGGRSDGELRIQVCNRRLTYACRSKLRWHSPVEAPAQPKLFVVFRLLDECPGGVQRYYGCRIVHDDVSLSENVIRLNEIELAPWQPDTSSDDSHPLVKASQIIKEATERLDRGTSPGE